MTVSDDGSGKGGGATEWVEPDVPVRPLWWEDSELQEARAQTQVTAIVEALGGPTVVGVVAPMLDDQGNTVGESEVDRDGYGFMLYMFRRGRILTRDEDVARVIEIVGGQVEEGGISGVSVVLVDNAMAALAEADRVLGAGRVFPDHVVHVTSLGGGACPATEPLPTRQVEPSPLRKDDKGCDGRDVVLSLVDTGFDPRLAAKTWWLQNGVAGDAETYDPDHLVPYAGHGTFAAGMVRAMAINAEIFVHGFLLHGGAIFESQILDSFQRALLAAPDIISMSAGTHSRGDLGMIGFRVLWEKYAPKGTVLIAAAGNDGSRKPFFPAAERFAIGVGALDENGNRAGYSNYGGWVDVYALGSDVVNAFPIGTYDYQHPPMKGKHAKFGNGVAKWSGTSFSTPLVAGVVAARMSRTGESGQQAAKAIVTMAQANATPGVGAVVEPSMACPPD